MAAKQKLYYFAKEFSDEKFVEQNLLKIKETEEYKSMQER